MVFSLKTFNGWFRLSINATTIEENKCVDKITLRNAFTDPLKTISNHSETKAHRDFCGFFTFFHFNSSVINHYVSYDIMWCVILFSIHYRYFTVKKVKFKETSRDLWWLYYPYPQIANHSRHFQMSSIRLSLNVNTCILVASCFYT